MTLSQLNPMFNHDLQPVHPLIKGLISGSVDHCPNHNGKQLFNFISREAETWQSTRWLSRKAMSDMILNSPTTLPARSPSWQRGKVPFHQLTGGGWRIDQGQPRHRPAAPSPAAPAATFRESLHPRRYWHRRGR